MADDPLDWREVGRENGSPILEAESPVGLYRICRLPGSWGAVPRFSLSLHVQGAGPAFVRPAPGRFYHDNIEGAKIAAAHDVPHRPDGDLPSRIEPPDQAFSAAVAADLKHAATPDQEALIAASNHLWRQELRRMKIDVESQLSIRMAEIEAMEALLDEYPGDEEIRRDLEEARVRYVCWRPGALRFKRAVEVRVAQVTRLREPARHSTRIDLADPGVVRRVLWLIHRAREIMEPTPTTPDLADWQAEYQSLFAPTPDQPAETAGKE
jgi:hypothetical protein